MKLLLLRKAGYPGRACQWWKVETPSLPASGRRCAGGPGCWSFSVLTGPQTPWTQWAPEPVPYSGVLLSCFWSCCIAPPLSLVLLTHVVLQKDKKDEFREQIHPYSLGIPSGGPCPILPLGRTFYSQHALRVADGYVKQLQGLKPKCCQLFAACPHINLLTSGPQFTYEIVDDDIQLRVSERATLVPHNSWHISHTEFTTEWLLFCTHSSSKVSQPLFFRGTQKHPQANELMFPSRPSLEGGREGVVCNC